MIYEKCKFSKTYFIQYYNNLYYVTKFYKFLKALFTAETCDIVLATEPSFKTYYLLLRSITFKRERIIIKKGLIFAIRSERRSKQADE